MQNSEMKHAEDATILPDFDAASSNEMGGNEPSGKLDNEEIARLIALTQDVSYSNTSHIPVKPQAEFQSRSLVDIAMEAQRRRDQAAADNPSLEGENLDDAGSDMLVDASSETIAEATSEAVNDAGIDGGEAISPSADDAGLDMLGESVEPEISPEEEAAAQAALALEEAFEKGRREGLAAGEEIGQKAGYEKGHETGRAAGQAEATAQLETSIQGFERAAQALTGAGALDIEGLYASINNAILALASERAGIAIAENPEAFARRIEGLLASVEVKTATPQIRLNTEDFGALKPIIKTREKLKDCNVIADTTLASGDVRLLIDGVGIEDELRRAQMPVGFQPQAEIEEPTEINPPEDQPADQPVDGADPS
ncbi:FliH/SctL family protein [Alphaproteobacteria bacterium]|nr:FliH/SctL family protein [Alphaproteobacteria bacterium]